MCVKLLCCVVVFFFSIQSTKAQWKWPEGKENKAKEMNVLYNDYLKQGNYEKTLAPLHWLILNAPSLNASLYINASKIYEKLALREKDLSKREIYADSSMHCFDLRIKYFNQKKFVRNKQAYVAYKLYSKTPSKYPYLLDLFKEAYKLSGIDIAYTNLVGFMNVIRLSKKAGEEIPDTDIIQYYDEISKIINQKIEAGENVDKLKKAQETIDKILYSTVKIDCNYIKNVLSPKLKEDPKDLKTAEFIYKLCLAFQCTKLPVFIESVNLLYQNKPNYPLAKLLATKALKNKEYQKAIEYLKTGIKHSENTEKKSDLHVLMALSYRELKDKKQAREQALLAANSDDKNNDKAYTFIGNLYLDSYKECKQGKNLIQDRAIYIAAYEMFKKANNEEGMKVAKAQFPTAEEIFTYNMNVGDMLRINCWVDTTVKLQKR